ncbi:translation initiation factor IF-3, mitochondrial isoform X2 [Anthonomus grandis grandis]|uniref:translation initiation factor IF-3, mitochondrial isoform X2 n=1 Tax=Anthonomus grandis grandis TaxID=2921223 RepID=UPI002165F683|nr:translation initiation factor IF-3, mitochondrial isoform X2 [Anthonomus grandis grandis]
MFINRIISRLLVNSVTRAPQKSQCLAPNWFNHPQLQHHPSGFSNKVNFVRNATETDPETGEVKKKKTPIIPKITLLHGDELTVTTLEEAQKLAKRRDLKLMKVTDIDTKTQRAVYRLLSGAEYLQEDLKQREKKKVQKYKGPYKGEKMLNISQNISEHDLQTDVNKIVKWLAKRKTFFHSWKSTLALTAKYCKKDARVQISGVR